MWHVGVGYLNHRIKIETQTQVVPMIELDYKKGYDRLTTGIGFSQFIGYAHLARSSFYNFYGGIYALQGITKERRTIYFDQPKPRFPLKTELTFCLVLKLDGLYLFIPQKKIITSNIDGSTLRCRYSNVGSRNFLVGKLQYQNQKALENATNVGTDTSRLSG